MKSNRKCLNMKRKKLNFKNNNPKYSRNIKK